MACGLAIIIRASYHFFETEWQFLGDTLDALANYTSSRVFVFDGIASTVEYALAGMDGQSERAEGEDPPQLSKEACAALSRILTRFVLGFYQGDISLSVPAMLCLEKVYRRKVDILRSEGSTSSVPDKDFWQNVAVAVYSVCRSPVQDISTDGIACYRRLILQTEVDQISPDKWVAILYLMVNKQPPILADASRCNTFSVAGQLLIHVLPVISHNDELREDLEELISQYAALAEENLARRGNLFEKTIQTLTYVCDRMMSDEWKGEKQFSAWANDVITKEMERVGRDRNFVLTSHADDAEDVSEISDSAAEDFDDVR
jgi:hypothetical protein